MDLQIKQIGAEKFDEYLELLKEMMIYIFETGEHPGMEDSMDETKKKSLLEAFEDNKYEIHIAYLDEKPIGFIALIEIFSTFMGETTVKLDDIYLSEQYRGKGHGTTIMNYIKSLAKQRNYGRIDWTTQGANTKAQKFYEKNGAVNCDYKSYRYTKDQYA